MRETCIIFGTGRMKQHKSILEQCVIPQLCNWAPKKGFTEMGEFISCTMMPHVTKAMKDLFPRELWHRSVTLISQQPGHKSNREFLGSSKN